MCRKVCRNLATACRCCATRYSTTLARCWTCPQMAVHLLDHRGRRVPNLPGHCEGRHGRPGVRRLNPGGNIGVPEHLRSDLSRRPREDLGRDLDHAGIDFAGRVRLGDFVTRDPEDDRDGDEAEHLYPLPQFVEFHEREDTPCGQGSYDAALVISSVAIFEP